MNDKFSLAGIMRKCSHYPTQKRPICPLHVEKVGTFEGTETDHAFEANYSGNFLHDYYLLTQYKKWCKIINKNNTLFYDR